jgi:Tfp pilus assembly protein FimV
MSNYDEFKRSLDRLVQQAQTTAALGLGVAKEEIETLIKNPNVKDQMEEVRKNLQTMAHEMETRAQEMVHLAGAYVNAGGFAGRQAPSGKTASTPAPDAPSGDETETRAGAGTAQTGSDMGGVNFTHAGEVPKQ